MANNTMIKVDGVAIHSPSSFSWGLNDISAADSGRTEDTIMHKNRIGQKRKIELSWSGLDRQTTADILQRFNNEYVDVTYPDAMDGVDETRTFYVGDRTSPIKWWYVGNKRYETLSFNIIER